jgi:DNA polymerase III subunit gamma/tau
MEKNNNLNLARKWRPKNFSQIVGQQIPVKMLLNSLYLDKLFPVYLFAGQRGCGKTSMARVLATAINCKNLDKFRENPKEYKTPCLECESCKAMTSASHPDFIEIDAASHTGVENVRQILESCSYMPILGKKKIYLIDEAHMLSKAAFNAFLKILEEPPSSALFILATTEKQKFPETVLSRCFQVIFKAVDNKNLKLHIKNMCKDEEIDIEEQAIDILIQETQGSVRDAINMLERVRFSETQVTTDSVLKTLGKVSESEVLDIFEILIEKDPKKLLTKLSSNTFDNINPETIWNMLIETFRAAIWVKFNTLKLPSYFNDAQRLKSLAARIHINKLNFIFHKFWTQEEIFLRTSNKKTLLEVILIQICQENNLENKIKETPQTNHLKNKPIEQATKPLNIQPDESTEKKTVHQESNNIFSKAQKPTTTINNQWQIFIEKLKEAEEPFLLSILSQAEFIKFNENNNTAEISLLNDNSFTQETIQDNKKIWHPILKEVFTGAINFEFIKKKYSEKPRPVRIKTEQSVEPSQATVQSAPIQAIRPKQAPIKPRPAQYQRSTNTNSTRIISTPVDTSDKEKYPKANMIQEFFPGKIKEIK